MKSLLVLSSSLKSLSYLFRGARKILKDPAFSLTILYWVYSKCLMMNWAFTFSLPSVAFTNISRSTSFTKEQMSKEVPSTGHLPATEQDGKSRGDDPGAVGSLQWSRKSYPSLRCEHSGLTQENPIFWAWAQRQNVLKTPRNGKRRAGSSRCKVGRNTHEWRP